MQLELFSYANVSYISQNIDKNDKSLLIGRSITSRPNKYIGINLTKFDIWKPLLIQIENHKKYKNDINTLRVMHVTRLLEFSLRLRLILEIKVYNGLKACYI